MTDQGGDQVTLKCEKFLVGRVIGRRGETIRNIENSTNCKVTIKEDGGGDANEMIDIVVAGVGSALDDAVNQVEKIIEDGRQSRQGRPQGGRARDDGGGGGYGGGMESRVMLCEKFLIGRVIGRRGETIRGIESETGGKVRILDDASLEANDMIEISFSGRGMDSAYEAVERIVEEGRHARNSWERNNNQRRQQDNDGAAEVTTTIECEKYILGQVVGEGGEMIKQIEASSGAKVTIDEEGAAGRVIVSGKEKEEVAKAAKQIHDIIKRAQNPEYEGSEGKRLRKEASECLARRTELFAKADRHTTAGEESEARACRSEASKVNEAMKELHSRAAEAIYRYNNAEGSGANGRGVRGKGLKDKQVVDGDREVMGRLDLHGLFAAEGMSFVDEVVSGKKKIGGLPFKVVTGEGHHSGSGGPAVKGLVVSSLKERGVVFEEVGDGVVLTKI